MYGFWHFVPVAHLWAKSLSCAWEREIDLAHFEYRWRWHEPDRHSMLQGWHCHISRTNSPTSRWNPRLHCSDSECMRLWLWHLQHSRQLWVVQLGQVDKSSSFQANLLRRLSCQRRGDSWSWRKPLLPVCQYFPLPSLGFICFLLLKHNTRLPWSIPIVTNLFSMINIVLCKWEKKQDSDSDIWT